MDRELLGFTFMVENREPKEGHYEGEMDEQCEGHKARPPCIGVLSQMRHLLLPSFVLPSPPLLFPLLQH
ncbi:hypothetical protein QYF36_024606 [Acer negundo]|nr:hypothetical protein QYF36_024606 [Acer negundo]